MSFLLKMLSEHNQKPSLMRVMTLLCCLTAIVIAFVGLNKAQPDYSGISLLVSTFLTAAMGGKIIQKRTEVDGAKADIKIRK